MKTQHAQSREAFAHQPASPPSVFFTSVANTSNLKQKPGGHLGYSLSLIFLSKSLSSMTQKRGIILCPIHQSIIMKSVCNDSALVESFMKPLLRGLTAAAPALYSH